MFDARVVHAGDEARRAARDLRRIHNQELSKATRAAVRGAVNDKLPQLLRASALAHMPSGYGPILAPALRVTTRTSLSSSRGVRVSVTIYARGKVEHRDVYARNIGSLRHPVFGWGLNWVGQRIRPGFADKAIQALQPILVADIDNAVSKVAERFNVGR